MSTCHVSAHCQQSPEEGMGYERIGVTDSCEVLCGCWEENLVLWKSSSDLNYWATSLVHCFSFCCCCYCFEFFFSVKGSHYVAFAVLEFTMSPGWHWSQRDLPASTSTWVLGIKLGITSPGFVMVFKKSLSPISAALKFLSVEPFIGVCLAYLNKTDSPKICLLSVVPQVDVGVHELLT